MLHHYVPWVWDFDQIPVTIWRDLLSSVIFFLRCCVDGIMTIQWNKFYHRTSIVASEVQSVGHDTNVNFCNHYNLAIGDRWWKAPQILLLSKHGDGMDIPNSPGDVENGSMVLLAAHVFDHEHLHQTKLIAIPVIISGLSHYKPAIAELYHKLSQKLGVRGGLSIYSEKENVKICIDWICYDNGDWPWKSNIQWRCQSHSGTFPFPLWVHHIGKKFWSVRKRPDRILKAIQAGIKKEHMPYNLNVKKIKPYEDFYCLAVDAHWRKWGLFIDNFMNALRNVNDMSYAAQHKKRLDKCNRKLSPVLYYTELRLLHYILDVLHCIIRHAVFQYICICVQCHCVFKFEMVETMVVLACARMFFCISESGNIIVCTVRLMLS